MHTFGCSLCLINPDCIKIYIQIKLVTNMFSFFKKKLKITCETDVYQNVTTNHKSKRADVLEKALNSLESGDFSQLHIAYSGIIENKRNYEYINRLGSAISVMLDKMSCTEKIRLAENFRQYSSMEWYADWEKFNVSELQSTVNKEQDFISILIIGSIHSNGYYREKCLRIMSGYKTALPFIILRINDWIENIRNIAESQAFEMCAKCTAAELIYIMPYITKVNNSERRDNEKINALYKMIIHYIKQDITENDILQIAKIKDFYTKKYAYIMLFSQKVLSSSLAKLTIKTERNKFLKSYITCKYIELYKPDIDEIDILLKDKNYLVRYTSAQYKYNRLNDLWNGAEELLLDKSRTIREYAVFLFRKHKDYDVAQFYRDQLVDAESIYAVLGLGECGSKNDINLILPYINSQDSKLVSAALTAIRQLSDYESAEIYWEHLFHECISISKTAYLMIQKSKSQYGANRIYDALIRCESKGVKRYLILILTNENSWERLPYLLKLYQYEDEQLQFYIHNAIAKRNPFARVSENLAFLIKATISEQRDILPKELVWKIEHDLQNIVR